MEVARQRPAILGTGTLSVKVNAASQHVNAGNPRQKARARNGSAAGELPPARFRLPLPSCTLCQSREAAMTTVLLLFCSNVFMTFAWYGHLKYGHSWPLWKAVLVSWLIALVEYCFAVPANRIGFVQFSGFQLKIIQEAVTLAVFMVFAVTFLKERLAWNYVVSFVLIIAAAAVAFGIRPSGAVG
jgi:hypothetical protein